MAKLTINILDMASHGDLSDNLYRGNKEFINLLKDEFGDNYFFINYIPFNAKINHMGNGNRFLAEIIRLVKDLRSHEGYNMIVPPTLPTMSAMLPFMYSIFNKGEMPYIIVTTKETDKRKNKTTFPPKCIWNPSKLEAGLVDTFKNNYSTYLAYDNPDVIWCSINGDKLSLLSKDEGVHEKHRVINKYSISNYTKHALIGTNQKIISLNREEKTLVFHISHMNDVIIDMKEHIVFSPMKLESLYDMVQEKFTQEEFETVIVFAHKKLHQ